MNTKEYDQYMDLLRNQTAMQAMNQDYLNQKMYGMQQANYQRTNPLAGADLGAFSASEIASMMEVLNKVYEQKTLDTPMWSPTKRQCNKHESLANAYNELLVIKKLVGI